MSSKPEVRSFYLIPNPLILIPNFNIIRDDLKIAVADDSRKFFKIPTVQDATIDKLQKTTELPEKELLNIPRKRVSHWNNYIVHCMHCDYLESWRDDCKVPDNWIGPKLKKPDELP